MKPFIWSWSKRQVGFILYFLREKNVFCGELPDRAMGCFKSASLEETFSYILDCKSKVISRQSSSLRQIFWEYRFGSKDLGQVLPVRTPCSTFSSA
jgi:hypothetical protein